MTCFLILTANAPALVRPDCVTPSDEEHTVEHEMGRSNNMTLWTPMTNVTAARCGISLPRIGVNRHHRLMRMLESTQTGIELSGVTKSYGSIRAVRDIDMTIAPGEMVALLGPNGAGKTTTIEMILGLTHPDQGEVSVFGVSPSLAVLSGWVGGMLQSGSLPDHLRVAELVTLVASYYPHPLGVDEVLHLTGTTDIARQWSTKLSGGQAQRVGLAAALVGDPDLLVLDEPTSGIDVEGRREFWRIMRSVAERGKTVLFATHYLEEADTNADRIVLMARGRVAVDGSPSEIKTQFGSRHDPSHPSPCRAWRSEISAQGAERRASRGRSHPHVLGHGRCPCRPSRIVPRGARHRSARHEPRRGVLGAHRHEDRNDSRLITGTLSGSRMKESSQ